MVPIFPNFKKIELTDEKDIKKFTSEFLPYSDFNFISMWSWDIKGEMCFSQLNGNLVVRFTDYINGDPFYSFLGNNKVNETAKTLIELSEKEGIRPVLELISEESIKKIDDKKFKIEEDRTHFDYIFSTSQLATFVGKKYKTKRNDINKLLTLYPDVVFKFENSISPTLREGIANLSQKWTVKKELNHEADNLSFENEKKALSKILQIESNNLLIFTCFLNNNLLGFEIDEILSNRHSIAHFSKVDTSYNGLNDLLNMRLSQHLKNEGVEFCNWEQDLGIENLKKSKMSYSPIKFFKKYKVSLISK